MRKVAPTRFGCTNHVFQSLGEVILWENQLIGNTNHIRPTYLTQRFGSSFYVFKYYLEGQGNNKLWVW